MKNEIRHSNISTISDNEFKVIAGTIATLQFRAILHSRMNLINCLFPRTSVVKRRADRFFIFYDIRIR